jgi:hypothetical protein
MMDVFEFIGRCVVYGGLFMIIATIVIAILGYLIFGAGGDTEGE